MGDKKGNQGIGKGRRKGVARKKLSEVLLVLKQEYFLFWSNCNYNLVYCLIFGSFICFNISQKRLLTFFY